MSSLRLVQVQRQKRLSAEGKLYTAVAGKTSDKSKSLRVYIPVEIAEELKLKDGDTVGFTTDEEEGETIAKMKKMSWRAGKNSR